MLQEKSLASSSLVIHAPNVDGCFFDVSVRDLIPLLQDVRELFRVQILFFVSKATRLLGS